jgi:hypothetical protein
MPLYRTHQMAAPLDNGAAISHTGTIFMALYGFILQK